MILNNTQANIFKVNGGIANNFANRPAASGSFYIFYSIDTQEIYYDNGAWILIGSGGGGVNIYNSDGTLTGNRTLDGNNNLLAFNNVSSFSVNMSDSGSIRKSNFPILCGIDFSNSIQYFTRIYYRDFNNPNDTDFYLYKDLIKTQYNANDIGLKLDFGNQQYIFGDNFTNPTGNFLYIDNLSISTNNVFNGSEGIILDFGNRIFTYGDPGNVNGTNIFVDDLNESIKTRNGGNDIGIKLDFANSLYQFGQITGGNQSLIEIDDIRPRIGTKFFGSSFNDGFDIVGNEYVRLGFNSSINKVQMLLSETGNEITTSDINGTNGFRLDFNNQNFQFGYFVIPTNLWFEVDNTTKIIKTINNQNNNGLKLDFANTVYQFGQITGGFLNQLVIDDANQIMGFKNGGFYQGFKYEVASLKPYQFGQITSGNLTSIYINDNAEKISASINNADNGLILDFQNAIQIFGDVNDCYIQLEQGNSYQFQLNGSNISSGSAGGASGQHLKIKINGVDYKIELRNP